MKTFRAENQVMKKKIFVLLFIFCLAAAIIFSACNKQEPPVKIGLSINLSGRGGDAGEHIRDGALLAVEEVNNRGGIKNRPFELLIRDDQNSDSGIQKADESLIAEGVVAIIGHSYSSATLKAYPYVTEHNTLLVTGYTGTTQLSGKDDLFIRTSVDCVLYGQKTAELLNNQDVHSVAFLMDMTNPAFVTEYSQQTQKHFAGKNYEVRFDSRKQTDWNRIIAELIDGKPDAIVFLTEASMTGVALQKLKARAYKGKRIATPWAQSPGLMRYAGSSAEGLRIISFIDPDNNRPQYLKFATNLEQKFHKKVSARSVRAYELVMILADALERCDKINSLELKKAMLSGNYSTLIGNVKFDRYGDVIRPLYEIVVKDGRFINRGII